MFFFQVNLFIIKDKKTDDDNFIEGESIYKSQSLDKNNKINIFRKSDSFDKNNFNQTSNSNQLNQFGQSFNRENKYPEFQTDDKIKGRCCTEGSNKCIIFQFF